ncbi:MAG: DUF4097 family beta strand repeat-containing protein [Streptococcaceae bacterium]|jgi:DUF4097 and DUF4098 domain-containing protein YvlB|nr:DUF4097 family beta strand repeat-containing protein [Streptococcaceae bacterium]
MADNKKERILKLMRDGVITQDEALELLEKAGISGDGVGEEAFDNAGYRTQNVDAGEALKSAFSGLGDSLKNVAKSIKRGVDENVDFSQGFPKVRATSFDIEKDLEGDFNAIEVDLSHVLLTIRPGENAHLKGTYKIYGGIDGSVENFLATHTTSTVWQDVLTLSADSKRVGAKFELWLPEKQYEELKINALSGKIDVKSVSADRISVTLLHGEVRLEELTASELSVDSKNGNILALPEHVNKLSLKLVNGTIKFDGSFEEADASLINGSILLTQRDARARKLSASVAHGDVKLSVPENLGLVGHARATFGGYKTRLNLLQSPEFGKNGGAIVRNGEETLTFDLETKTGTIWLKDNTISGSEL